jgi:hypothetical protein
MKGLFKTNFWHSFNPKGVEDKFQRTDSLQSNLSEATAVKSSTKIVSHLQKLRDLIIKPKQTPLASTAKNLTDTANSSKTFVAHEYVSPKAESILPVIKSNINRPPLVSRTEPHPFEPRTLSLHEAAKKGDLERIENLVAQGNNLRVRVGDLKASEIAILSNHKEVAQFLASEEGTTTAAICVNMSPELRKASNAFRTDPLPSLEGDGVTKSLPLNEIYRPYHEKGITGKTEKIAIIDSGYQPSKYHAKPENISYFQVDKPGEAGDLKGHGTAITNMIHDALPDAHYMILNYEHEISKIKAEFSSKASRQVSYEEYKAFISHNLEIFSKFVRHSVDEGATAINLSQGLQSYTAALGKTYNDTELLAKLNQDGVLEPWKKALEHAKSKEVPIFKSAGNDGLSSSFEPLLAIEEPYRSALIIVGNTDEHKGIISNSSSRLHHIKPDIAASGSGDLRIIGAKKSRDNTIKACLKNASGTSFATPDVLALYGITQSAREAKNLPRLTIEEFRTLLKNGAIPVEQAPINFELHNMSEMNLLAELHQKMERKFPKEALGENSKLLHNHQAIERALYKDKYYSKYFMERYDELSTAEKQYASEHLQKLTQEIIQQPLSKDKLWEELNNKLNEERHKARSRGDTDVRESYHANSVAIDKHIDPENELFLEYYNELPDSHKISSSKLIDKWVQEITQQHLSTNVPKTLPHDKEHLLAEKVEEEFLKEIQTSNSTILRDRHVMKQAVNQFVFPNAKNQYYEELTEAEKNYASKHLDQWTQEIKQELTQKLTEQEKVDFAKNAPYQVGDAGSIAGRRREIVELGKQFQSNPSGINTKAKSI